MIQKIFGLEEEEKKKTEFSQKYHLMAIKQYTFFKVHYFYNKHKRENVPIISPWFRSTKQFMIIR